MVLRKNVTIGFSPDEYLRLQGAAAIARMPVSTYLKWLLQGSPVDGMSRNMSAVLAHLDEISSAIARLPESLPGQPTALVQGPPITQRELLRKNLKARGFPSSTIRQVDITLDEMEKNRWGEDAPACTVQAADSLSVTELHAICTIYVNLVLAAHFNRGADLRAPAGVRLLW